MSLLFKTNLRKKLLTHLFTHPNENFYVREIASSIDEDAGNLSRELNLLAEEGLCSYFRRGNSKFYSLNHTYPLFNEFKQIIEKTEGVQGTLKELVDKSPGIKTAFIYGSFAKNKAAKTSDIDLVVAGKFSNSKFLDLIRAAESKLNREINYTAYTPEEFEAETNKKGAFLNIILKDKLIPLKGKAHVR
jgi:predicted nucleotidyltransferase